MHSYIREPLTGKPLAYWDGEYVRNPYGEILVSIDDNYVREGAGSRQVLANLDGVFIREGVASGRVIAHIDRDLIRTGSSGGNVLFLIDSGVTDMEKCALAVAALQRM